MCIVCMHLQNCRILMSHIAVLLKMVVHGSVTIRSVFSCFHVTFQGMVATKDYIEIYVWGGMK